MKLQPVTISNPIDIVDIEIAQLRLWQEPTCTMLRKGACMKIHSMLFVVGIIVLSLSGMVAGCAKKEGGGDKIQAAIEAVSEEKTPENYLTLSLRYYQAKQFDKCIKAAQEAIKLKPDFAPPYNNICAAYNEQKMWDKGIEACQQALKIDPGFQLARNNLNWALSAKAAKNSN